jgi:Tat protein translocase TatB subunit
MFNVGSPELVVILMVALIVLGPQRLPEVARQVGKAMGELRRLSTGFQAELRDAMEDVAPPRPPEPTTATILPVEPAVEPVPPVTAEPTVTLEAGPDEPAAAPDTDGSHEVPPG